MLALLATAAAAAALAQPTAASSPTAAGGCAAHVVTIRFDPRGSVTVTGDRGTELARATSAERRVLRACARPVSVSPPITPKAIARRVTLTCAVKRPVEIEAHAIVPTGSALIVAERGSDTWL